MKRAACWLVGLCWVASTASAQDTLSSPIGCDDCIANWFYFDQNGDAPGDEDWSCASSSYDGHRGTDFSLRGGLGAIADGNAVVAAAAGTVVSTLDGHFDACTSCPAAGADPQCGLGFGSGYGNHVVINHGDRRVVYAHLRNGSVRVAPGDTVACGDPVGEIASSGCSTGAHLHFEVRPLGASSRMAFDPYAGGCSPTSPSLWTEQGAHRAMPSRACAPVPPSCPPDTFAIWTCTDPLDARRRCVDGLDETEPCAYGCAVQPVGTDDTCAPPPDTDGDGVTAELDCDDQDADRFPGHPEVCGDGVDQDCDDEDLPCARTDAGRAARDASPRLVDAGRGTPLTGSCGCRAATGTPLSGWLLLVPLALGRRRRSRR